MEEKDATTLYEKSSGSSGSEQEALITDDPDSYHHSDCHAYGLLGYSHNQNYKKFA